MWFPLGIESSLWMAHKAACCMVSQSSECWKAGQLLSLNTWALLPACTITNKSKAKSVLPAMQHQTPDTRHNYI